MIPSLCISLVGEPKSGKTHFAMTFPDPICLFSFDIGAKFVRTKFPDKEIDIRTYPIPIIESAHPKPYAEEFYHQIKEDYTEVTSSGAYKTVVIDTGTALWEIVRHAYTEEKNRKQILRVEYAEPNARMSWFLMQPMVLGVNVVATHYLKDRYVNDANTGEKVLMGFAQTNGIADIIISLDMPLQEVNGVIVKSRFDRTLNGFKTTDPTYDDIIQLHGWED